MVKQVSIGEVFEFVRNGASIKQEDNKSGYPITRIETIWNETIDDS
jgi:type I restriction enzyme S subunit